MREVVGSSPILTTIDQRNCPLVFFFFYGFRVTITIDCRTNVLYNISGYFAKEELMVITLSYPVRITNAYRVLLPTLNLYRACVKSLIGVVLENYSDLEYLSPQKSQRHVELLVHSTKNHSAIYPFFDREYYKFPSYLRRSAISESIRIVSSHMSAMKKWCESKPSDRAYSQTGTTRRCHL